MLLMPAASDVVDRGQHVLQGVPELVEQRLHLAEGHQRRLAVHRAAPGCRPRRPPAGARCRRAGACDPGSPPPRRRRACRPGGCRGPGRTTPAAVPSSSPNLEVAHVRVPDRRLAVGRRDHRPEQPPGQGEQPVQHPGQREIRAQLLFLEGVALLAQALGPEGDVPQGQRQAGIAALLAGELGQLGQLALGPRSAGPAQLVQQRLDRRHLLGHLPLQAQLGERAEAQQPGLLPAQLQDPADQRLVVLLARRGPGDEGPVQALAQIAPAGVLHERHVQRRLQGDAPGAALGAGAGQAGVLAGGLARRLGGGGPHAGGQALDLGRIAQHQGVGLGGVEQVVREPGATARPARSRWPRSAAWPRPPARRRPARPAGCWTRRCGGGARQLGPARPVAQGDEAVVERPALPQAQRRRDHLGLHRLLGLAQGGVFFTDSRW